MNKQNVKLSVIAYYLSKYDVAAVNGLGYKNRADAIKDISTRLGSGNSYLKLRRDEFDVLTGSHRRGYANREPVRSVLELHSQLKDIPFADFTSIVLQLINPLSPIICGDVEESSLEVDESFSDLEVESIINATDTTSTIVVRTSEQKHRVYNRSILENLKKLYQQRCQICGYSTQEYGVSIAEAHHILPFSDAQNNDSDNIIILCPNHHRLIHKANPIFDRKKLSYTFVDNKNLKIQLNLHL